MKCKEDLKYYRNITKERKIFDSLVIREGQDALGLWFYPSQKFRIIFKYIKMKM